MEILSGPEMKLSDSVTFILMFSCLYWICGFFFFKHTSVFAKNNLKKHNYAETSCLHSCQHFIMFSFLTFLYLRAFKKSDTVCVRGIWCRPTVAYMLNCLGFPVKMCSSHGPCPCFILVFFVSQFLSASPAHANTDSPRPRPRPVKLWSSVTHMHTLSLTHAISSCSASVNQAPLHKNPALSVYACQIILLFSPDV